MVNEIPEWEASLWSQVSIGDGNRCPIYSNCQSRQQAGWCIVDIGNQIKEVFDYERFSPKKLDYSLQGKVVQGDFYQALESLANNYLRKGNVHSPPVPTELVFLANEKNNIEIRTVPLKTLGGALLRERERWVIYINSNDPLYKQRFTLFHEFFHILAHCRTSRCPVFRRSGANRGHFNELLADCFAAHILIPEEWLKAEWQACRDLDKIARTFAVPKSVVWFRLNVLGLIRSTSAKWDRQIVGLG